MTQLGIQKSQGSGSSENREKKFNLVDRFLGKSGLFWNRLPISPELIVAWCEELEPYTAEAIEKGMKQYFKEETFFPVPGSLIPLIKSQICPMEPKQ